MNLAVTGPAVLLGLLVPAGGCALGSFEPETIEDKLVEAIWTYDREKAVALLDQVEDLNTIRFGFGTEGLVSYAARHNRRGCQILKLVLERGGDPNGPGRDGRSALYDVLTSDYILDYDVEATRLLIEAGLTMPSKDVFDYKYVLKKGEETREYYLRRAILAGKEELGRILLDWGANPHARGEWPLIHLAVHRRQLGIVDAMLEHGADASLRDHDGRTPLHYCTHQADMAMLLRTVGRADPDARDAAGRTPLQAALEWDSSVPNRRKPDEGRDSQNAALIGRLIQLGADPTAPCSDGLAPLLKCTTKPLATVEMYTKGARRGVDLDVRDPNGDSLLHHVVRWQPADTRHRRRSQWESLQSLHIQILLQLGADPNVVNAKGETPLHLARRSVVHAALLAGRADPRTLDREGNVSGSAFAWRLLLEQKPIRQPVLKFAADAALRSGDTALLDACLANGFDPDARPYEAIDPQGERETLLHLVSARGDDNMVHLLLAHGADVSLRTRSGKTAAELAEDAGHEELAAVLRRAGSGGR